LETVAAESPPNSKIGNLRIQFSSNLPIILLGVIHITTTDEKWWEYLRMRMNLITTRINSTRPHRGTVRYSLTVKPAFDVLGDYNIQTTREQLLNLLTSKIHLATTKVARFERSLATPAGARLLDVEMSESVLTEIGYFID
jgi:hypothetical protein